MMKEADDSHLPSIVFAYIKPTLSVQFIMCILLPMGRFSTEIDLVSHSSLKGALHYTKLIGPSDEQDDLKKYSDSLLQ
eukprot:13426674-Ditylum_brightwellii.AAC.1